MDQALFHLFIQRLTSPSQAALQALGILEGNPAQSYSQLVVVIQLVDGRPQPIDTVAKENFLAYEIENDDAYAVISSLAIDRRTAKPYVHRVKLVRAQNAHVEKAVKTWAQDRDSQS
ncbi:hypothetical protein [Alcaligenes pakistanensis]|nr:hypothetical protein [Alcaligenes pakistanensis]